MRVTPQRGLARLPLNTPLPAIHLLPKDLRFEYGDAKLASCPGRHL